MTRPFIEAHHHVPDDYRQEIAHIYDLLRNICTFKKVRFTAYDKWTQSSDGYYKLSVPCTNYVALAAFENIEGASDKRANCVIDVNKKYTTVTSTYPFDGYLVVADVNVDDDNALAKPNSDVTVDRELNKNSLNPVSNRAITLAINALAKQVADFEVPNLPDVPDWALTENKPMYSWDEICGKPKIITEIICKGQSFKNIGGVVILDDFAEKIGIPTKISELELDASIYDLKDGESLSYTIDELLRGFDDVKRLVLEQEKALEDAVNDLQANDNDLTAAITTTNSQLGALRNTVTQNYLALEKDITEAVKDCKEELRLDLGELRSYTENVEKASKEEDDLIHAQLSALAHECRLHHDMYDAQFASIMADISKLQSSSAEALVSLIKNDLVSLNKTVAEVEARTTALENAQLDIKQSETNGNITVSGKDILVYDDTDVQGSISLLGDDIDDAKSDIVGLEESIVNINDSLEALADDISNNASAINTVDGKVETLKVGFSNIEKELANAAAVSGLKVQESAINGNFSVLYPLKDDEGNVRYENGEVVYGEPNEIKVYSQSETLNKFESELEAIYADKGENANVIPAKVSELENDMNFVTRKQAAGLVASAQVNFDTAFEDDDPANITFVKTVNISNSQGSVIINGDDIAVKVDGITEIIQALEQQQATLAEQAELISQQAQKIQALETEIANLKAAIPTDVALEAVTNRVTALENNFKTFVDEDGVMSDGEQPLWEKQDQATAVTDSDALSVEEIESIYNAE